MNESLGDWSDGDTPGNIPNPAVKSVSADGTWRATSWESRSLPRGFSVSPASDGGSSLLINICMGICISSLPMVGGSNPPGPH